MRAYNACGKGGRGRGALRDEYVQDETDKIGEDQEGNFNNVCDYHERGD